MSKKYFLNLGKILKMKTIIIIKSSIFLLCFCLFLSCDKDKEDEVQLKPDEINGNWEAYSITLQDGSDLIYSELRAGLEEVYPDLGTECVNYTLSADSEMITTSSITFDTVGKICKSPYLESFEWTIDSDTNFYILTKGNYIGDNYYPGTSGIIFEILFTNSNNRMTWTDQTNGDVTVWDRLN